MRILAREVRMFKRCPRTVFDVFLQRVSERYLGLCFGYMEIRIAGVREKYDTSTGVGNI